MESSDYVILGAGLGGFAAAVCLSRQGHTIAYPDKANSSQTY